MNHSEVRVGIAGEALRAARASCLLRVAADRSRSFGPGPYALVVLALVAAEAPASPREIAASVGMRPARVRVLLSRLASRPERERLVERDGAGGYVLTARGRRQGLEAALRWWQHSR